MTRFASDCLQYILIGIALILTLCIWVPVFVIGMSMHAIGKLGIKLLNKIGWGVG